MFFISLSIEITQFFLSFISAGFGYARSFDIDDIILNTAGACVGYYIFAGLRLWHVKLKKRIPQHPSLSLNT